MGPKKYLSTTCFLQNDVQIMYELFVKAKQQVSQICMSGLLNGKVDVMTSSILKSMG